MVCCQKKLASWWSLLPFKVIIDLVDNHSQNFLFSYLPVYLWRHENSLTGRDHFSELLKLLAIKQREQDQDFDSTRVY